MTVILNNVKGYGSKKDSIAHDILEKEKPEVCLINETMLRGKRKINIPNYFSFIKSRHEGKKGGKGEGGGGGIATLVASYLQQNTVKVGEGREGDEYMIVRFDHVQPSLNIVNIYGENEKRAGETRIVESWLRLKHDLDEIKKKGEMILILGDMNRAIGTGEWGVAGNKKVVSPGGELIRKQLLKTGEFTLINNLELCKGGPFTWVQANKAEIKSCLDLGLASSNLIPFIKSMMIDSERKFTARRVIKRKNDNNTVIYTDHYAVKVEIVGMPRSQGVIEKETSWNFGKPGGWEKYASLSAEEASKVKAVVDEAKLNKIDVNEVMKKVDRIEDKMKFIAFGKTKPPTKRKMSRKKLLTEKDLLRKQSETIEQEIIKIKEEANSRVGQIYKVRDLICGGKQERQEAVAIRDPKTNELVSSPEEIKRVSLEYCVDNLKKTEPESKPEIETREMRKTLQQYRMNEDDEDGSI